MDSSFWGHLDPSRVAVPWYVMHSVEVEGSFCIYVYFLPQLPQHSPHSRLAVLPRRLFSSWYVRRLFTLESYPIYFYSP